MWLYLKQKLVQVKIKVKTDHRVEDVLQSNAIQNI